MGVAFVIKNATPFNMDAIAKVAINEVIFNRVNAKPLMQPISKPIKTVMMMDKTIGTLSSIISFAHNTPENASIEPMDKSILPVIIKKVQPTAAIPINETCLLTVIILLSLKKFGEDNEKIRISNIKISNTPYF